MFPRPQIVPPEAPSRDIAFAERVAIYLERKGLEQEAVVECLMEEFDLDRKTAEALASLAA